MKNDGKAGSGAPCAGTPKPPDRGRGKARNWMGFRDLPESIPQGMVVGEASLSRQHQRRCTPHTKTLPSQSRGASYSLRAPDTPL